MSRNIIFSDKELPDEKIVIITSILENINVSRLPLLYALLYKLRFIGACSFTFHDNVNMMCKSELELYFEEPKEILFPELFDNDMFDPEEITELTYLFDSEIKYFENTQEFIPQKEFSEPNSISLIHPTFKFDGIYSFRELIEILYYNKLSDLNCNMMFDIYELSTLILKYQIYIKMYRRYVC